MATKRVNWKSLRKKIPNRVQVKKDLWYEILWTDEFFHGDLYGEMRPDKKQIVLNKNQGDKETMHTLYHELIHLFIDEYEAKLSEADVAKMEKSLYYIIKFLGEFK